MLSGMTSKSDLDANIKTAETALPGSMTAEQLSTVEDIKKIFGSFSVIPCTGCGYCMPCPAGVAIPNCFSSRNEFEFAKSTRKPLKLNPARGKYVQSTGMFGAAGGNASRCIKCGRCEQHCPQGIKIRDCLEEVRKTLEPRWFSIPVSVVRKINTRK
ncbi:MAG: 4Fe-4S binding protein [Clostridiales bacterium]|nr:4Fe-4S binding protein [Clostridiales bacterium]